MLGTDPEAGSKRKIIAMTRYVEASGPNWRRYNDGAFAYRQTDPETGKTVSTYYCNGRGHAFYKNYKEGYEFYENLNTGVRRYKNLPDKKREDDEVDDQADDQVDDQAN